MAEPRFIDDGAAAARGRSWAMAGDGQQDSSAKHSSGNFYEVDSLI